MGSQRSCLTLSGVTPDRFTNDDMLAVGFLDVPLGEAFEQPATWTSLRLHLTYQWEGDRKTIVEIELPRAQWTSAAMKSWPVPNWNARPTPPPLSLLTIGTGARSPTGESD